MARGRLLRWFCIPIFFVGACGSDEEPQAQVRQEGGAAPMDASGSKDTSSPMDAPASKDTWVPMDTSTPMDVSSSIDAQTPMDAPADTSTSQDAHSEEASPDGSEGAPDVPDALDAPGDVSEVATADADAAAPPPADAASEESSAGDAGVTDVIADGAADASDASDASAIAFPGSALVDGAQGAMINGWIGTPTQRWKLCYSTALHVRSGVTFHMNCDFKGASVSIAKVSYQTETRIIGGYNSQSWYSPATATYSNNTGCFLFSVTNSFKHAYPGSSTVPYYIYNNALYGPTFGAGNDWYVHSQLTMGTCRPGYTYACRTGMVDTTACNVDFCGTPSGSEYYTLDALEVWVH
jgi:hypothetical protein